MAAPYQIYVTDILGSLNASLLQTTQSELKLLFDKVTDNNTNVILATGPISPAATELLVYFMPSGLSIIKKVPNLTAPTLKGIDLNSDGNTVITASFCASEVYAKSGTNAKMLARLAFHECMHNKLKLAGDALHNTQDGLGKAVINDTDQPSAKNIAAMKAALGQMVTQWADGIGILLNGQKDPLSEYYKI